GRLGILRPIGGNEQIKGQLSPLAVWGHPDRLATLFGLRLAVLRQFVEHVGRLMHPTPLPARLAIHLAQRLPKTPRPIPNGQGGPVLQPVTLEVEQKFFPGLLALAGAIPAAHEFFLAAGVSTNNDEETMARFFKAGLEVDAVHPEIDIAFALQAATLPLRPFLVPPLF